MVIENRSEPCIGNEPTLALVLVLEEWLDQKSAVLYVSTDSDHQGLQLFLLLWAQGVLGIKDRWGRVVRQSLSWVFLKGLLGEDSLNSLIEIKVSNLV